MKTDHNKRKFFDEIKESILMCKPQEMEVSFRLVNKHNRSRLHACTLAMPGAAAAPTFYLEDLYEIYLNGTAAEDIAQSLIGYAKENNLMSVPGNIEIDNYEEVKGKLGLMVIGADRNREYIKRLIHRKIEDLALIPIIFTNDDRGSGCIKIREEFLDMWDVTAGEVMDEAMKNAPRYMPPVFKQLNEMLCLNDAADDGLFVISNEYFAGGAAAVFYPGFLDSIGMALNKDLFILPSSINEMILVTDNGQDPGALLQIVKEVNRYHVAPEDVLTDAVYHYSRGDRGFHKLLPVTS